jgi:hypothetical protein
MSTPIRDEAGLDDSLRYAPRWARRSPTSGADCPAEPESFADSPPMAPGIGGPNIDLPLPPLRPFEGDVAVKDLRRRLALDPGAVPQPPPHGEREPALPWIGRFSLVLVLAAVAGFGVTLLTLPREARLPPVVAMTGDATTPVLDGLARTTSSARLVVESRRAFANEPLPLGVTLTDASGGESVTLAGLVSGTQFSAGMAIGPTGWQLAARDLGRVLAYAPKDFVGAMDAAIDLRSSRDRLVDSQVLRLEWLPKKEAAAAATLVAPKPVATDPAAAPPAAPPLAPEEITVLMRRGEEFLKAGDIASARLSLRRAAMGGSAQAALALGATYDPQFFVELGVLGLPAEPAQARSWYERAAELGSGEARRRLERAER